MLWLRRKLAISDNNELFTGGLSRIDVPNCFVYNSLLYSHWQRQQQKTVPLPSQFYIVCTLYSPIIYNESRLFFL